ncbi:MAG: abequosyltransferase [Parcubacteria group bacterium Licking1014_1]|nr:MAG: abequosyltransferase [Parcubacteria group bacterium Licking1014_1]
MKNIKMNNKPFLSIIIPTYNRAIYLGNLLSCIAPQVKESGLVQICISNNSSTDNTREVIMNFIEKYPGLIVYNENERNLGFDRNMFKVIKMAQGDFTWFLCDDDLVVENGIEKVIYFIKNNCGENIGFMTLATRSYFIDKKTGKQVTYSDTIEKDKPKVYKMDKKDIIGQCFPASVFTSTMLFNNNFLKKILEEEKTIIEKALEAKEYIQTFLYRLMFLKYPNLEALRFNEEIINEEAHRYKFYIEDIFQLHYITWTKLCDLLLSSKYMNDYYRKIVIDDKRGTTKTVIIEMGLMKSFEAFNYSSFLGCIKMFFQEAPFRLALLFSAFFVFFSIIPSAVLRNLYKIFIKIRHKEKWQKLWLYITVKNSEMSKGSRRLYD